MILVFFVVAGYDLISSLSDEYAWAYYDQHSMLGSSLLGLVLVLCVMAIALLISGKSNVKLSALGVRLHKEWVHWL